ncbi:hypothetical protein [Paraburkholderia sediminicola]|uniref:hypothetical protein n=1 Tax=Paraburkholderia sediminicola TaxID=458836 RepID=UPI0038BA0F20
MSRLSPVVVPTTKTAQPKHLLIQNCAPRALHRTFANQSVVKHLPVDLLQRLLGHGPLPTTTIQASVERACSLGKVGKFYHGAS